LTTDPFKFNKIPLLSEKPPCLNTGDVSKWAKPNTKKRLERKKPKKILSYS